MKIVIFLLFIFSNLLYSGVSEKDSIIFSSNRDGNSNIYRMDADGKNLKQLTFGKNEKWSPRILSKTEISFLEQNGDKILRFKLNLKTNKINELPQPEHCILDDKNAFISPKKDKLLYECNGNIFVSDKNGRTPFNLTQNSGAKNFKPIWFSDGKKIAFTSDRDGNREIYSIDLDGKDLKNLTKHPANDEAPDISPDGRKILFSSDRDGDNNQEIYVLNLTNHQLTNISKSKEWELIARWSSDGSKIFFGTNRDKNWEIYVYDFQTKTSKNITNNSAFDGDPQIMK